MQQHSNISFLIVLILKTVHIDNRSEFMAEFDKFIKDKKIIHHVGHFHILQGQKQIERFNRTLKDYLAQYFQKYNTKVWVPALFVFLTNYNNRLYSTTKDTSNSIFKSKNQHKLEKVKKNIKVRVKGTLVANKINNTKI
jgi:transposase InsO family protein